MGSFARKKKGVPHEKFLLLQRYFVLVLYIWYLLSGLKVLREK